MKSNTLKEFQNKEIEVKISERTNNKLHVVNDGLFVASEKTQMIRLPFIDYFQSNGNFKTDRRLQLSTQFDYIYIPERLYQIINLGNDSLVDINISVSVNDKNIQLDRLTTLCPIEENSHNTFLGLSEYISLDGDDTIELVFEIKIDENFSGKIFIQDIYLMLIKL